MERDGIGTEGPRKVDKFDIWERKLLDFSLRNSLLNLYVRRKAIQFISFDIHRIEDHLQDGEEYCILPKPDVDIQTDAEERLINSGKYEQLTELIKADIENHRLHTYLPQGETKDILKGIYRAARNAIEETGANSLFLAIGTLRWFETPQSDIPRYAPLLLLPVEMVYKRGNYFIRTREEEISLNITLMEFLRQTFEIKVQGVEPLPKDASGVDVKLILDAVREAIRGQERWEVEEECLLGIFSFSKFLMWNDVHTHREELGQNNIVSSLVANRLTWVPEPITDNLREIDRRLSPADTALPVAVDSSQLAAVIEGGKGNSFILYGPPGTGKSQTITNLIANALFQGKRVLFVAEKMAALSVVQKRLAKIGLDPFCLELHSNKATKRHVLQQLEKALRVTHIMPPAEFRKQAGKIFEDRKALIVYMNALHEVDAADGLSLYDCIFRYQAIDAEPMDGFRYEPAVDALLASEGVDGVADLLGGQFESVIRLVGQPSEHPLNGLHVSRESLKDTETVVEGLRSDIAILNRGKESSESLKDTDALRVKLLRDNSAPVLGLDAAELRDRWRRAKAKWFIPRYFAKRKFVNEMRKYNPLVTGAEMDSLLDSLLEYGEKHARIEEIHDILRKRTGASPKIDRIPDGATIDATIQRLDRWAANAPKMRDWLHWSEYSDRLRSKGLACVVEAMESAPRDYTTLRDRYLKALFRHKAEAKMNRSDALAAFEGMLFDEKVALYRRLTEEFQLLTQKELYARLASRIPRVTDNPDSSSEIGLLNRNISNGGRGFSLRDLFEQLPTLLPRLCPCMLMSPMSVAQYLSLDNEKFDLVVFDEASQMPTSEAVGAIARGKSLIVVGDPKQMPPTNFFSSVNVDEEEAPIDDMESILEDCRTLEIPSLQLSWHYRSRHESLIAFSNNEYYEGSLITFPSVDDRTTKVHHVPVNGVYDKGGKRSNRAEAEAIVKEIERRLRDENLRKSSIGVIAFSVVQQSLIEDLLQDMLDKDKDLHEAAAQMYEPIFVKNLENVQGDERDVILFSIGYGPDPTGKVSMNFGPLNNSGGERRLNVAVSRARREMYIFSTLKSADIDLRRTKARGVEGLKHFLEYAETQSLPSTSETRSEHRDSALAEAIAAGLEEKGYVVRTDVGRSQFKVDVAVAERANPEVYRLGILLDGKGYRDTHTTRDREIVQPSVLTSLGWDVMRVWSVDWFNNPARVIERIVERLESDIHKETPAPAPVPTFDISAERVEETRSAAREYKPLTLTKEQALAMSDRELMRRIITAEQPVTFQQVCRRACSLRGGRVTPTVQRTFGEHLGRFHEDPYHSLWLNEEAARGFNAYRPNSGRDIADIPHVEILCALTEALREQVAVSPDNLVLIVARKLGFTRRGANVDSAIRNVIYSMLATGKVENIGTNIRLKQS